jgi:putative protease
MARTVLVVDDSAAFRATARTLLTVRGYEVVGVAADLEGGLQAARELRPDCVLLDYHLPDADGLELLPELIAAGVTCFKIEGRMKGPEYVANVVEKYRRALDAAMEHRPSPLTARDEEELRYSFSRSFSHGFLRGSDHQELVHGLYPGHRGVLVGRVEEVHARAGRVIVRAEPDAPELKAGDRILFDQGKPEDDEPRGGLHACDVVGPGLLRLLFGGPDQGALDLRLVKAGDVVWKAKDAEVTRKMKRLAARERKVGLTLGVRGAAGTPLIVSARDDLGRAARVESAMPLQPARANPLHEGVIREKLCAFGETGFELRRLELELEGAVALPPSELKRLRRAVVEALAGNRPPQPARHVQTGLDPADVVAALRAKGAPQAPRLIPLLRTLAQVDVALRLGFDELQLDFMELVGLGVAVERARAKGAKVIVATPRVQKPGEEGYDRRFERLRPDGILARHLGAVEHFRRNPHTETVHGDFSLNATNALTARTLLGLGLSTLTPAYDLDLAQLLDLASGVPAERLEVTIHQHLPLFHNEHCVYSHLLSNGHDYRDCGRPCEKHLIRLRDGQGMEHPVIVDVGCRNTVFNAGAQSAAACLPQLLAAGVRRFRVELVRESEAETERVLRAYAALLDGRRTGPQVIAEVGALEKYGVSAGTLVVVTQPHA